MPDFMRAFGSDDIDELLAGTQDQQDEVVVELTVEQIEIARRVRRVVRLFKQGFRRFRVHSPKRGERVQVLSLSVRKGTAVVRGARREQVVQLSSLFPLV